MIRNHKIKTSDSASISTKNKMISFLSKLHNFSKFADMLADQVPPTGDELTLLKELLANPYVANLTSKKPLVGFQVSKVDGNQDLEVYCYSLLDATYPVNHKDNIVFPFTDGRIVVTDKLRRPRLFYTFDKNR
jgi:hypothetical protein